MRHTEKKFEFTQKRYVKYYVSKEIRRIENESGKALRELWRRRFWCKAPNVKSDEIFRLIYAWRLQARAFGGVDQITLDKISLTRQALTAGRSLSPVVSYLKPGMVLVRIWRRQEHRVLVRETGFEYRLESARSGAHFTQDVVTLARWVVDLGVT